jgi:chemotaxis methyl-accepting protein methylase
MTILPSARQKPRSLRRGSPARHDAEGSLVRGIDAIFCCNVLIYFDGKSKTRTVQHFYNALLANGYFFLGQSESLYGISEKFHLVHFPGSTAYWKPGDFGSKAGAA